jgi:hypothetical protein
MMAHRSLASYNISEVVANPIIIRPRRRMCLYIMYVRLNIELNKREKLDLERTYTHLNRHHYNWFYELMAYSFVCVVSTSSTQSVPNTNIGVDEYYTDTTTGTTDSSKQVGQITRTRHRRRHGF